MANDCLKIICRQPVLVNMISEQHLVKMFTQLETDECSTDVQIILTETFQSVALLITMRKHFLDNFTVLALKALKIGEFLDSPYI